MPEVYSRQEIEAALLDFGYKFLSINDGQALYQRVGQSALYDIVIDWYKDEVSWEALARQIKDLRLDAEPLHRALTAK